MDLTPYMKDKAVRFYGGANGNKIGIKLDGDVYMIKFPPKKEALKISYTNSCISEYICCKVYKAIGIPVQEVFLGKISAGEKEKIVVACKDFTSPGIVLQDFAAIKNSCIDSSRNGYGVELSEIMAAINEQDIMPKEDVINRFWDMFIVDALIGNFDRHNGNWGFLINTNTNEVSLAPVYDCGSSLLPQADTELQKKILNDPAEMDNRIFLFPTSAIKIDDKKINYYDFLIQAGNQDCNSALKRIFPKINMEAIGRIIEECQYIGKTSKAFYKQYLSERYKKILKPSYLKVLELEESKPRQNQPKFEIKQQSEQYIQAFEKTGI